MHYHSSKLLIVARDRGHVKALSDHYPGHEIVTASAFFDVVRHYAFMHNPKLKRDEHAQMVFLSKQLAAHERYSLHMIKQFSALYSACYHGTKSPQEVFLSIQHDFEFAPVFSVLKAVDEAMEEHSLVTNTSALFYAWQALKTNGRIPFGFVSGMQIELFHLVDLTLLEIEVIKTLSRNGVQCTLHFPLDLQKRGVNVAVDFIASQFEREIDLLNVEIIFDDIAPEGPLRPLVQELFLESSKLCMSPHEVSINQAHDVLEEAELLAQKVAHLKSIHPDEKIAVLVRSLDGRSALYQRAIRRLGVSLRDRKGQALLESRAGILLLSLLNTKAHCMAKKDLVALLHHPLGSLFIKDAEERLDLMQMIHELGIDDRVLPTPALCTARYADSITRMAQVLKPVDPKAATLDKLSLWLRSGEDILSLMADTNTFRGHLASLVGVLQVAMLGDDPSKDALLQALLDVTHSQAHDHADPQIAFRDFVQLISSMLSSITIPRPDYEDANAVEFLPLPEALGRSFDHIFLVDMSFGKLPKNTSPDPLMNDQARKLLNGHFKMPFLRVFFDDPFEPSPTPPRQALEPLWFLGGIASAKKSAHFFCAHRDEEGVEQAESEFFLWLLEHVESTLTPIKEQRFINPEEQLFLLGQRRFLQPDNNDIAKAFFERTSAFIDNVASPSAFLFDANSLKASFSGRIDEEPTMALTPSLIEAFSPCRFKGLMERVFRVKNDDYDADDIEPSVLGQIAHGVLERYFNHTGLDYERQTVHGLVRRFVNEVSQEYMATNYVKNPFVLWCHAEWLVDALVNLIERMGHEPWYRDGRLVASEKSLGLGSATWQAVRVVAQGRAYLLGGRLDRIDQKGDHFLITDYKLSTVESLKVELPKNKLTNSFQMPIYVRLVEKNIAKNKHLVSFAYASIRDGEMVPLMQEENPELYRKVFDDEAEESLPHLIHGIFAPIVLGQALATPGDHCSLCDFSYLCRKREGMHHGP